MGLLHSKGSITANIVAVAVSSEVNKLRQPCFLRIRKIISGAKAMPCGLVRMPIVNVTAESLGFESKSSMSESRRKNVYIASN